MAFPNTPLPARVKIAPGAAPGSAPWTWPSWVDITSSVRVADGITIGDGRGDEGALVDASNLSLTLDDRVGDFNPANPVGAYYPLLQRGCPIRVGVDICSDTFTRTSSSGWGSVSTPATVQPCTWNAVNTSWSVTGSQGQYAAFNTSAPVGTVLNGAEASDTEGRVDCSIPVVATGATISMGLLTRFSTATGTGYAIEINFDPGGTARAIIGRLAPGFTNLVIFNLGAYTAGQVWTIAYQVVGGTIAMKAWPTLSAEPAGWQLGYSDTSALTNGVQNGVFMWRQTGNTNAGTTIQMSMDNYHIEDIEYAGNIVEFPVTWDQSGKDSTAPLRAAGVFRRLQQGTTPVKSPLLRQYSSAAAAGPVLGLWMMEDDTGATFASSQAPSGTPATVNDVAFGAATDLPGSLQQAKLNSSASLVSGSTRLRVTPGAPNGLNYTSFHKLPSVPPTGGCQLVAFGSTGPIVTWSLRINDLSLTVIGYDSTGAAVATPGSVGLPAGFSHTSWFAVSFYANNTAGTTVSYNMYIHQVGVGNGFSSGPSGTYSTTIFPSVTGFTITGNGVMAGSFLGPVRFGDNNFPFLSGTFKNVAAGWLGEAASDRITRLCMEAGVPCYAEPSPIPSEPMGIQRVNPLFALLRECEATDFGILYEAGWGIAYRPRSLRYSRPAVLALDRNSGHLAAPPTPTLDDQRLINDVTVSRDGGAQGVRVFDQASVTASGTYDTSLTLNTSTDGVLANHAAWRVYLGIVPDLRWPDTTLDLMRNTSIIAAWRSRVFADRMQVANELAQVQGSPPDVIIEGTTQTLSAFEWTVQCNCSPAKPWDVATLDDANLRMDTAGSTVATAPSPAATGTSMTVATTSGPLWVTTAANPAEFPFNINVAGEIMTVTAIVGTSSPQTFTVTRNVNALPNGKAQVSGAAVALQRPMILAL